MNLEIKSVGIESIDLIVKWRTEIIKNNVLGDRKPNATDEDFYKLYENTKKYYKDKLSKGEQIMCFAFCDDVAVACGGACVYDEIPSWKNINGKCGYIMNIYTRPEYRKMGIATATVEYLIDKLKLMDVQKIYLRSTEMGKSVYEKIGFSEMKNYMQYLI